MTPRNPFKPSFGTSPPLLVGRDDVIQDFEDALDDGPGSPGRATIFTGARGTGKTVMLNAVQGKAAARGWLVIAETAIPGLVERLVNEHLPGLLSEHDPKATKSRLSGVRLPASLGGISFDTADVHQATAGLRSQVSALCQVLAANETGLLLTVDELHRENTDELVQVAAVVQHAFRDELEFAFVGAGLPSAVNGLLNENVLTFLRRADVHHLGKVNDADVARALREPIVDHGRSIGADALEIAVGATAGYPFLIQLVGHQTWRRHPEQPEISREDAVEGAIAARRRLGSLVHDVSLKACSEVDKTYLLAMAMDDGPSRTGDVKNRLGTNAQYANVYRGRLIAAELIEPVEHGMIDFAVPYLREYLREHGAADAVPLEEASD